MKKTYNLKIGSFTLVPLDRSINCYAKYDRYPNLGNKLWTKYVISNKLTKFGSG